MFGKKRVKKSAGKIDKIVTGVIIGTAVASMVGLSQTKKGKEVTKDIKQKSSGFFSRINKFFGKTTLFILKIFNRNKK
ncbi:hypothetical protein BKN14_02185 [Candidatus Gracilibacteria bacterium HOT-871]|nr:hypothetical protein BKN14_02185 [Candidatus Gracilibacteria bacterium HOT-871]MBB1564777.1 hypothetical protein [Candidatus Gracilibacteria bacterium]MBF0913365.1 hypothetical protein [Candidatus Gracilibacteria bacterium]RKW22750.1 MAG: hypothetical protein D8B46_04660 [Candidatus Gracilibacteria bacterium]